MALTYFNLSQKELESKCRERQLKTSANNKEELRQRLINHDNASKDDQHPAKRQRSQEPDIRTMLRIPLQPISKNIDTNLAETSNKRPAGLSTLDSYVASAVATISPTISAISTPGISTTPFVPATPVIPVAPAVPATPLHRCKATTPLHRCKATARNADQDNTLSTGSRLSTPHDYTVSSTSDASVPPTTHATPSYGGQATAHETLPLSKVTPSKALNARGFGLFSVLGSIDLAQDRPEGLSTFECEGPEVMVKCAKEMMDPSVIQTINQGVVPVGTEMGALGGQSDSWRNKEGGGGYSATVPPAEGSNICTTYGGSTKAFKRRLPEQHFSQTYRDKIPTMSCTKP